MAIQTLKELIAFASPSDVSNREITEYIRRKLSKFQAHTLIYKRDGLNLFNLIVKIPGRSSESPLVFIGHTDTVKPGDLQKWKTDPFVPTIQNNRLYGLGASDMKGALACMIAAAESLKNKPNNDIYLIFDADEEDGGTGGKNVLSNFSLQGARVIVGEPTNRKIVHAHRGCLDLEIILSGQEKHGAYADSRYNSEHNAINKAARVLPALIKYAEEIENREDEYLGRPNMTIGVIQGGKGANSVPGSCSIKVNRRIIPGETLSGVQAEIENTVRSLYPDAKFNVLFSGIPFKTQKESKLVTQVMDLAKKSFGHAELITTKGWTEAALFQRYGEAIIFGPGNGDVIHQPNEYVELEDLQKFTEIYHELMNS